MRIVTDIRLSIALIKTKTITNIRQTMDVKVKISLLQAMEAHRVGRS
jgi:hypothetical protein